MTAAGVQVIVLLALSDEGAPAYDHDNAAALAALGVPAFACTPDAFPDLMAAAIQRQDLRGVIDRLRPGRASRPVAPYAGSNGFSTATPARLLARSRSGSF